MPDDWSKSTFRYGRIKALSHCSTYWPIRLISQALKIFDRALESRLQATIELPSNQRGFVKSACTAHAITVRIVMEKYREQRREIHAIFLDMEKAFDKVPP
ncbi:unnamed protein product [Strongylus vulgaris]|uniref:Reverse transcriptase domain-containing protein n=1 Tax=Strongylus vulgaris TaxID=40348 RepID=A0A3P7JIN4_STRVU|nr:unnamed protein product [Strongylus vulgaris]